MVAALEAVAGKEATALLEWKADPAIEKLVSTWPGNVRWDRAAAIGLKADASFEQVVRDYARENPEAVKLALR
ncbi:MAG: NAD-dependent epimerase, partial [Comamonadaceae bacterium]